MKRKILICLLLNLININIYSRTNTPINIEKGFNSPINLWNINSKEDDFAPFFMEKDNYLIFNSIIKGYSKYFIALINIKDTNISFQNPYLMNSELNQNNKNAAYFCLINNNSALVNAYSMFPEGNFINIKKTTFERNNWTTPATISELSEANFIGHPTISPNKNVLIFTSNKNSPNNKTDIWSATLQNDGTWNMLIPIDELNSIGNEITPHFINDTTIIFASDGFNGKGGYDLFYAYYINGTWTKPLPLEDINTEYNETDPLFIYDNLIFASDRTGGKGGLDLYFSKIKNENNENEKPINKNIFISATNYQLNITLNIEYDLISAKARQILNKKDDSLYILTPNIIEFNIENENININKIINYKLFYQNFTLEEGTINNNSVTINNDSVTINNNSINKNNNSTNKNIIINFIKYATKLFQIDSCFFTISSEQFDSTTIPIEIFKSENKKLKIHSENNNHYCVFAVNTNDIKSFENMNNDIIPNLKELINHSKNVEILINSEKMYNEIIKMFNIKNKTTFIKTENTNIIEFKLYNF